MEDFLTKLQKISKQSNSLILEKNLLEKRISNIRENINEYDEMKEKYVKDVELKKNQLLNNKNKHLIKCQKMEELNNKLNEILIRKQNIDNEEDKLVVLKQMDIVNKTFHLLKNVQKLSDSLETTNEEYRLTAEQIRNQNFNNRKTINMLNCFLKKNLANVQDREESETDRKADDECECQNESSGFCANLCDGVCSTEIKQTQMPTEIKGNRENDVNKETYKMLNIIPTKEMNKNLKNIFSQSHTTLPIEKQQFLFVFEMNILNRIINKQRKRTNKTAEIKNKTENEQKSEEKCNIEREKEKEKEKEETEEKEEKEKNEVEENEKEKEKDEKEKEKGKEEDDKEQNNEKYNKMIHQFIYQYYITA